jgi:hypothetical protein
MVVACKSGPSGGGAQAINNRGGAQPAATVDGRCRLAGRIVDRATWQPADGASLVLDVGEPNEQVVVSDPAGRFELVGKQLPSKLVIYYLDRTVEVMLRPEHCGRRLIVSYPALARDAGDIVTGDVAIE